MYVHIPSTQFQCPPKVWFLYVSEIWITLDHVLYILFSDIMLSINHLNISSLNSTYQPFEGDFSHIQLSQNENGRMFPDIFSSNNNFGESIKNPFAPITNSEDYNILGSKEGRKQRKRKNRQVQ